MLPLISIIVPVYNVELYLDKCIQSIINQTYKNIEIILVDDGSTDSSGDICDKYAISDDRIKVIHKKNGGSSSARNRGLDIALGRYIGFVDSDDWIAPTMYDNMFSLISDDKTIVGIGLQEVDNNGMVIRTNAHEASWSREELLQSILLRKIGMSACRILFPASIISDVRFVEDKLNEDLLFMLAIMNRIDRALFSSEIGYFYLRRAGSLSRTFGKSVRDMTENSKELRAYANKFHPALAKEAEFAEIYQHMSFLFCCPYNYDRKNDPLYSDVLSYVRKHRIAALKNPHFTKKDKIKLLAVSFFPRFMSLLLEKKSQYDKNRK